MTLRVGLESPTEMPLGDTNLIEITGENGPVHEVAVGFDLEA